MNFKNEKELEKYCVSYARERGWVAIKLEKNEHKGIPDRFFFHPENFIFFFVELKNPKKMGVLSPYQKYWQKILKGVHYVVSSFDEFRDIIEKTTK